jgi:hypothetical protein
MTAANSRRSPDVAGAPISGKRPLAREAPNWIEAMATTKAATGPAMDRPFKT